eukprot:m.257555 g.257555  ORF g.257555 m.257555 type:complete len:460 (-) comp35410_c0_seq1:130-1509(-)
MAQFTSEEQVHELWTKDKKEVVMYDGVVYDVSTFAPTHPGGVSKITEYLGKAIDEPFKDESHSKYAVKLVKKLPVVGYYSKLMSEKLEIELDDVKYKRSFCCSRKFVIKKLFTKEDPLYLHKILGLFALCSFAYRYGYCMPTYGNLNFNNTWFDHFTIAAHLLLSCSSLIFEVLKKRVMIRPLVIWNEYRLHAIVFTLRCAFVYTISHFWPYDGSDFSHLVIAPIVLLHHLVVDEITRQIGPNDPNNTTVRGKDNSNAKKLPATLLQFYALYQFSALGSHLLPHARSMDLGYNTLGAIQSSAFLMTLFRKGLIRHWSHGFWYTLALVLSFNVIHALHGGVWFWTRIVTCALLRIKRRWNKYVIWTLFVLVSLPSVEKQIFNNASPYYEPITSTLSNNTEYYYTELSNTTAAVVNDNRNATLGSVALLFLGILSYQMQSAPLLSLISAPQQHQPQHQKTA